MTSTSHTIRIGNAAGFLGDQMTVPSRLLATGELDYLTLEYLAELTLAILARQRRRDPALGYARDFVEVLGDLIPELQSGRTTRIVTNAGGLNTRGCIQAAARLLASAGLGRLRLGIVEGDDLSGRIDQLRQSGHTLAHLDSGEPFSLPANEVVCASAYLGAEPIARALAAGADIVVTGRVADASLVVGPAMHEFSWGWDDWPSLAAATLAGHLIECGAQVTGGYLDRWRDIDLANVGYPIAELTAGGSVTITKPDGSGGVVDRETVAAQLLYEIGDPAVYLTPDVVLDLSEVEIRDQGDGRVHLAGAGGRPAPDDYKVSLVYEDGFATTGELLVWGEDCTERARAAAAIIHERLTAQGARPARWHVETLGDGTAAGVAATHHDPNEVVLRVSAHDPSREVVERFAREIAPLITSGPAGLAGYASGRPKVRSMFAYWPTLIAKSCIEPAVTVKSADEWASVLSPNAEVDA
ncbi:MAG: DUF1446 domain-containing protein [Planctomycetales bacterium]|nr:DUF1446 domain-containing protein [Planctomycetales bacterium]